MAPIPAGCCKQGSTGLFDESAADIATMSYIPLSVSCLCNAIVALSLCLMSGPGEAAQAVPLYWQCSDQCEQNASLENKPVKHDRDGTISLWWSLNFSLGNSAVRSAEILTELDCSSGQGRDRAILYFAAPNLAGGVQSFSIDNPWYVYTSQRFGEFLHHACQQHAPAATASGAA